MNSNKILKVYANSKKSELGLGDYIRIASFLPNLNFKKIHWYSNKELFPIIKKIDFIDKVYDLKKREKIAAHPKKIKVINLYENGKNDYENLYIKNFFQKKRDIKNNTVDIYDKFADFYNNFGTEVTVIEALPNILPIEDEEVSLELKSIQNTKMVNILRMQSYL